MSDIHARARDHHESQFPYVVPNESELTAGVVVEPGKSYGFFTDTTLCIGCKACEVACKEWNNLPADNVGLTGQSYDNTGALSANTWRHVNFIEQKTVLPPEAGPDIDTLPGRSAGGCGGVRSNEQNPFQSGWLMMSDVCKHCHNPPCMEACPTGALFKTEFDTVVVQQDICNGCGYCVPACPFGVIDLSLLDGKAHKCTLCYDRLKASLEPACAKSCPTESIQFGEVSVLQERAKARVEKLHGLGVSQAYLYGAPDTPGATGGLEYLNAFFLLTDRPEAYNLPVAPTRASRRVFPAFQAGLSAVAAIALAAVASFALAREGSPR
ncbi:MAG: 4Fe-4S dicluster domain-containing protein [Gluconacetobacter diazotrophicus]|nr:4Fe-4S dicluster domain-containing protein [Gluconacetobacter diazotrophicus]